AFREYLGETARFGFDDLFGAGRFAFALLPVLGGDRLQVVNVEDKDVVEVTDGRINVARDRDVDQEHWLVAPCFERAPVEQITMSARARSFSISSKRTACPFISAASRSAFSKVRLAISSLPAPF